MFKYLVALGAVSAQDLVRPQAYVNLDFYEAPQDDLGLQVTSNTVITVEATENRSTGYAWEIINNDCGGKVTLESDDYAAHAYLESEGHATHGRRLMGEPGRRQFVFTTPGESSNHIRGLPCEVTFAYKRPWLDEAEETDPVKKVKITVN